MKEELQEGIVEELVVTVHADGQIEAKELRKSKDGMSENEDTSSNHCRRSDLLSVTRRVGTYPLCSHNDTFLLEGHESRSGGEDAGWS